MQAYRPAWISLIDANGTLNGEILVITDPRTSRNLVSRTTGILALSASLAKEATGYVTCPEGPEISEKLTADSLEQHVAEKLPYIQRLDNIERRWLREDTKDYNTIPWLVVIGFVETRFPFKQEVEFAELIVRSALLDTAAA